MQTNKSYGFMTEAQFRFPWSEQKGEAIMPIESIEQPDLIEISPTLRLKKYAGVFDFALPWYQDPVVLRMSEGPDVKPYTLENLKFMYSYLDSHGELYWIEQLRDGEFVPIGDVTLEPEDLPIVLGFPDVRGRGIGRAVIRALIERARSLGWDHLSVQNIYDYNLASQKMFLSCGFQKTESTETGASYRLLITQRA